MGTGRELFAVRSPFRNPTIRGSVATDPLDPGLYSDHERRRINYVEPLCHAGSRLHRDPGRGSAPRTGRPASAPGSRGQPVADATNPLPPEGAVPSAPPGILDTPDGWHLEVVGSNETQLPVAPLTTAISSREYLVAGTFTGKITGGGKTKLTGGSMEAGEQIGCGIISDETEINPGASFTAGHQHAVHRHAPFTFGISLQGKVYLKPGTVTTVAIDKKSFKGTSTRVTITGRPDQDRPVRRAVVHPLLRDADELD